MRRARRARPPPRRARSRSARRAARWQAPAPMARAPTCLDRGFTSAARSLGSGSMTTEASCDAAPTQRMDQFCTSVTPKLTSSRSRERVHPPVPSPFVLKYEIREYYCFNVQRTNSMRGVDPLIVVQVTRSG